MKANRKETADRRQAEQDRDPGKAIADRPEQVAGNDQPPPVRAVRQNSRRQGKKHPRHAQGGGQQPNQNRIAQKAGVSLAEIAEAFSHLPKDRPISGRDWVALSTAWQRGLEARIALLTSLRDDLGDCIGCGCLSVENCPLVNADDRLAALSAGAHRLPGTG